MSDLFKLTGKIALITGGSRGIGEAIAKGYANVGVSVAVFDRDVPSNPQGNIRYYQTDLANREKLHICFNSFIKDFGSIDILVNNAGVTFSAVSEDYSESNWDTTLAVNLTAVFLLCQWSGQQMIKQGRGGSIINVTSIGSAQGFPGNPAYQATKGALRQLTKALAYDWGKYNIRVNNLAPGYTNTPMNKKSWNDAELNQKRASHTFLNRWAEPEDMVGPAIFLASDASRYMTSHDLFIDGGWVNKGL